MPNATDDHRRSAPRPPNTWKSAISGLFRAAIIGGIFGFYEIASCVLLLAGGIVIVRLLGYRWGAAVIGLGIVATLIIVCQAVAKWEFWREEKRSWIRVPARVVVFGVPVLMALVTSFAVLSYLTGWP